MVPELQDDIRRKPDQFRCVSAGFVGVVRGPANVHPQIAALGPPQLLQSLTKLRDAGDRYRIFVRLAEEHSQAPHVLARLRPRRERPAGRAADERDELAPLHCLPVHAKFGVQLRPSKQESAPNETGEWCGNVRRTHPAQPMSELGQTRSWGDLGSMSGLPPKAAG
jgi:hypothetical protein